MAAHLKKRAMAEYASLLAAESSTSTCTPSTTTTVTADVPQAPPPPSVKRLKLIWKPASSNLRDQRPPAVSVLEPVLANPSFPSSHDVMQAIVDFSTLLPVPAAQAPACVAALSDVLAKETDPTVKVKIVLVLGELALAPSAGEFSKTLTEVLKKALAGETSHKARAQYLLTLGGVGKNLHKDAVVCGLIFSTIKDSLKDTNHFVRRTALEILVELCPRETPAKFCMTTAEVQHLLVNYTDDADARVRTGAFVALLTMHRRGLPLERSLYEPVCAALSDENEGVRAVASELVWVLCQLFPESPLTCPDSKEELRLVDDGFGKLCSLVGDLSMNVRAKAAGLLGSLHLVSQRFLDQTLDKKLMSNMRKKVRYDEIKILWK